MARIGPVGMIGELAMRTSNTIRASIMSCIVLGLLVAMALPVFGQVLAEEPGLGSGILDPEVLSRSLVEAYKAKDQQRLDQIVSYLASQSDGDRIVPALRASFYLVDPNKRSLVVWALGFVKGKEATRFLLELAFRADEPRVSRRALGLLDGRDIDFALTDGQVADLLAMIRDPNELHW